MHQVLDVPLGIRRTGLWWQDAAVSPGTERDTGVTTNQVAGTRGSGPADRRQATRLPDGSIAAEVTQRDAAADLPVRYRTPGETEKIQQAS